MKRFLSRAVVIGGLVGMPGLPCGASPKCEGSWMWVASAYANAVAWPNGLPGWARDHPDTLGSDTFQHCASLLAEQLAEEAVTTISYDDIYPKAMEIATNAGRPELGPKIAEDAARSAGDLLRLARWIRQISAAIPDVLADDDSSYHQSEPYQLSSALWQGTTQLIGPPATEQLKEMTFELSVFFVLFYAQQIS